MKPFIEINGRRIGADYPPYFIAEVSANHGGNISAALKTIQMAKEAGADAVKIQSYTPDTMTIDSDLDDFIVKTGPWADRSLYDLYGEAHTPFEWHSDIFEYANKLGITLFSTPFDESAIDLLESLNTPAYKVASFELNDHPLLARMAQTGKPVILSTGMANEIEIEEAVKVLTENGCEQLAILHCISGYPTPVADANIATVPLLLKKFPNQVVGLSDHTLSSSVSITAVALGASLVEKHVTVSRQDKTPDSDFSLEPEEIKLLVKGLQEAWCSLGEPSFKLKPSESSNTVFRRSIYVVQDVKRGEIFTTENIRRIRPGFGLHPKFYDGIIGKKARLDLKKGKALQQKDVEAD